MACWWARQKVDIPDEEKKVIEDRTGCIPLFLDKCVVGDKVDLGCDFFREVFAKAKAFEEKIQTSFDEKQLDRYTTAVLSA